MYTAVINIKTEPETKRKAQQVASEIGVSLSALINAYLKGLVRTKKVEFSLGEEPSPYLIKIMKKAEKNLKEGKASPVFRTGEEAVKWLEEQGI
jgi:addiction module RelB/DinJ family antitoxin